MGIVQKLINMDEYFRTTTGDKIIVNDLSIFSPEDLALVDKKVMTTYDKVDAISIKASCDCGKVTGMFKIGQVCNDCSSTCREPYEKLQPILWLKAIDPNYKFLNPIVWIMVSNLLSNKMDALRYFSDTRYNPVDLVALPDTIQYIKKNILNDNRTYPNLMANLSNILNYLLTHQSFKDKTRQETLKLTIRLIEENKDKLFSNYMPILNKRLFVTENTTTGRYVLLVNADSVDAIKSWMKLCSDFNQPTERRKSNITGSTMACLATLYKNYARNYLCSKNGIFRKNVYGARSHFTFRCVITSITGKHKHYEIEAPWCVGVTAFRPHLLNKLKKLGYNYKQASSLLFAAVQTYNPLVDKLLKELIKESKYPGIPIILQRNPSLLQGSAQLTYITRFKTDPLDMTCGISFLICKAPNADFDGAVIDKNVV